MIKIFFIVVSIQVSLQGFLYRITLVLEQNEHIRFTLRVQDLVCNFFNLKSIMIENSSKDHKDMRFKNMEIVTSLLLLKHWTLWVYLGTQMFSVILILLYYYSQIIYYYSQIVYYYFTTILLTIYRSSEILLIS